MHRIDVAYWNRLSGMVSVSVGHHCEPCKTAEWIEIPFLGGADSYGFKEPCVRWRYTLVPPGEYMISNLILGRIAV